MSIHIDFHNNEALPLVLFHGWGFDSQIWQSLLLELTPYFSLYLVDLPGFGKSSLMDWPQFKKQLLTMLPEQFSVLGWSLGGLYATKLAIEASHRVSHLINIASLPRFLEDENWKGIKAPVLQNFYALLAKDPLQTITHFLALQKFKPHYIPEHVPSREALHRGLDMLGTWDLRAELEQFSKPTAFMFGRLDAIVPFAALDQMRELYPYFNYYGFRKSAHMPFLSEPAFFIENIKAFLL